MKKRINYERKTALFISTGIALLSALMLAVYIRTFIGYTISIPSEAGSIAQVVLHHVTPSSYWFGMYGLAFFETTFNEEQSYVVTGTGINSAIFVFDCLSPTEPWNEIYASINSNLSLTGTVVAGTTDMIDNLLNISPSIKDSARNTFIQNASILLGTTNISGIPAAYTYVRDLQNITFFSGILNVSNEIVIVSKLYKTTQTSFKNTLVTYQKLIPVLNSSTKWYFHRDPYDNCPSGSGTGLVGDGIVSGYAYDKSTNLTLANVTVSVGGSSMSTDSAGFYNMSVATGDYVLVGIKEGYLNNITYNVSVAIGFTTNINVTLEPFTGFEMHQNGSISGLVIDNSTNASIANATISIAGRTVVSNTSGNYLVLVSGGTHNIVAIKSGYNNFVGEVVVNASSNTTYNIYMGAIISENGTALGNVSLLRNGTLEGFARDNGTSLSIVNVSVSLAGVTAYTNNSGFYSMRTLEGAHNLVAVKDGYDAYADEVTISANNITQYNFSMRLTPAGSGNGTVSGTVKTISGTALSGVSVSAGGKSNISDNSGNYALVIPQGTHNIVATKSGYNSYIALVNVTAGNITYHNITMNVSSVVAVSTGQGTTTSAGKTTTTGAGEGSGAGAGISAEQVPKKEIPKVIVDYEISVRSIIKKLRVGNFIGSPITISNYRKVPIKLNIAVEGSVKPLIRISNDNLMVESGSSSQFDLTIFGDVEPGVYDGSIVISGDINEKIPVNILVYSKERLPVEALLIEVIPVSNTVYVGEDVKFRVELQNLLSEEKYVVSLSYDIMGIYNNSTISLGKDDVVIWTSFSLLKDFPVPKNAETGDYVLVVTARFLDMASSKKAIIKIVEPIYKYALFGILPLWMVFIVIGVMSTGTFSVMVYKKKSAEKKRYKIIVDIAQLPKAGARSAFVGNVAETSSKTYFDLDLFQVHTLVAGASGSGKSIVAQILVEEALLKKVAVIVFDPSAQWSGFLRRSQDKKILALYQKFGMKKTDARGFNGNIHQVSDGREIIDIKRYMKPGEINIFVTNKLDTKGSEIFVANAIREIFHANMPESKELIFLMVYDGIHSLLPKYGGTGEVFVQVERASREFRKWGVGLMLVSQVLGDFPPEVLANINTQIMMRARDEKDLNRVKEEYGEDVLQSLVKASVGSGLVENASYNKGKPYFVAFRPPQHSLQRLTDEELDNYNKYNEIIDEIDYQIEQLEKDGVDMFDLRLELKLSQDKLKSGNFNMVNIYLEGLTPRLASFWKKMNKSPKKREKRLISEEELREEMEKAKSEKEKSAEKKEMRVKSAEDKNESPKIESPEKKDDVKTNIEEDKEQSEFGSLIKKAFELIDNNNLAEAKSLYSRIQQAYKILPADMKKKAFADCVSLGKRIAEK